MERGRAMMARRGQDGGGAGTFFLCALTLIFFCFASMAKGVGSRVRVTIGVRWSLLCSQRLSPPHATHACTRMSIRSGCTRLQR
jgi:hypothetical protein